MYRYWVKEWFINTAEQCRQEVFKVHICKKKVCVVAGIGFTNEKLQNGNFILADSCYTLTNILTRSHKTLGSRIGIYQESNVINLTK